MNAYNPLASMKRLEDAGLARPHAEAIASEIEDGRSQLVTEDRLEAALDRQTIKLSIIMAGMLTLFCTIIGVLTSLFAR
jgi:hypothetical protein